MNFDDIEALRTRSDDGPDPRPSNLDLDRLVAGQLDPDSAERVRAAAASDPETRATLGERERGFDALPVDPRAMLAHIRSETAPRRRRGLLSHGWRAILVLAPAAVAMLIFLVIRPDDSTPLGLAAGNPDAVRLGAWTGPDGERRRLGAGGVLAPESQLHLTVSLTERAAVRVFEHRDAGGLRPVWPADGTTSRVFEIGDAQTLDGAIALEASPGARAVHLIACPPTVEPACTAAGEGAVRCPDACAVRSLSVTRP